MEPLRVSDLLDDAAQPEPQPVLDAEPRPAVEAPVAQSAAADDESPSSVVVGTLSTTTLNQLRRWAVVSDSPPSSPARPLHYTGPWADATDDEDDIGHVFPRISPPADDVEERKEEPTIPQQQQNHHHHPLDSLDCIICSELVFDPFSLPCGHTVCMTCWDVAQRDQNQRNKCPAGCADLLHNNNFARIGVNVMLRDALVQMYPSEYAARGEQVAAATAAATPAPPVPVAVGSSSPRVLPGGLSTEIRHRVRSMQMPNASVVRGFPLVRDEEENDEILGLDVQENEVPLNNVFVPVQNDPPADVRLAFEHRLAQSHGENAGRSWDVHLLIVLIRVRLLAEIFLDRIWQNPAVVNNDRRDQLHAESWAEVLHDFKHYVLSFRTNRNGACREFVLGLLSLDGVRSSLFWLKWPLWMKDLWNFALEDFEPLLGERVTKLLKGAINHFPLVNSWGVYRLMLRGRVYASIRVWPLLLVAGLSTWACAHLLTQTFTSCNTDSFFTAVLSCPISSTVQMHAAWKAWAVRALQHSGPSFAFITQMPSYVYLLAAFFTRHPLLTWWCMLLGDLAATWSWSEIVVSSLLFFVEPRVAALVSSLVIVLPIAPVTALFALGNFLTIMHHDQLHPILAPWAVSSHFDLMSGQLAMLVPSGRKGLLLILLHVLLQTIGVSWFFVTGTILLLALGSELLSRSGVHASEPWWYALAKRTLRFFCAADSNQIFPSATLHERGSWRRVAAEA
jgi:hypothetical protein